jgi:hypothetical protein
MVAQSEKEAWKLGQANEQLAYFDLAKGKSVELGRIENGKYIPHERPK